MIYLPARFQSKDSEECLELVAEFPLATMITVPGSGGEPYVSHVPLILKGEGESLKLVGHLARANAHWKMMDGERVTVIFHGPQAYITPNWYVENDVPTWNYAVVHFQGTSRLIEDFEGISRCLQELTAHVEKGPKAWKFWLPPDLATPEVLPKAIVGFEIDVTSMRGKFKLSQNRIPEDRAGAIRGLENERSDENSRKIAELMKKR